MRTEKSILTGIIFLALNATVAACPECRARVESDIYKQDFAVNLLLVLLPIFVLTIAGVGLYSADYIAEKFKEKTVRWQTKQHALR